MSEGDGGQGGQEGGDGGQGGTPPATPPTPGISAISDQSLLENPGIQKYMKDGNLSGDELAKGYLNLQQTLGKDKIVMPKEGDNEDVFKNFNSAIGVPESADGYEFNAVNAPEGLGVELFDQTTFKELAHKSGARKDVASKMWDGFTSMMIEQINSRQNQINQEMEQREAKLSQDWGQAYKEKTDLGQSVVDTFSSDKDMKAYLESTLMQNPMGKKFLAELGGQFKESSIANFQNRNSFALSPKEARIELNKLKASPEYTSDDDMVRGPAVDRANELMAMIAKGESK